MFVYLLDKCLKLTNSLSHCSVLTSGFDSAIVMQIVKYGRFFDSMKRTGSSQETKRAQDASLKKLMNRKPLSKITINEIVQDCGVNRNSFYYHFEDIYALFKWMLEQEAVESVRQFDLMLDYREAIQFVMDYVSENRHIVNGAYDAMGREGLKRFFYADFIDIVRSYIDGVAAKYDVDVDGDYKNFLAEFFTEAISGTILNWCTGDHSNLRSRDRTLLYLENIMQSIVPQTLMRNPHPCMPKCE